MERQKIGKSGIVVLLRARAAATFSISDFLSALPRPPLPLPSSLSLITPERGAFFLFRGSSPPLSPTLLFSMRFLSVRRFRNGRAESRRRTKEGCHREREGAMAREGERESDANALHMRPLLEQTSRSSRGTISPIRSSLKALPPLLHVECKEKDRAGLNRSSGRGKRERSHA
jgi:hypothetical protein